MTSRSILLMITFISALTPSARASVYDAPRTLPDRQTMVHLFEWKWTDIATECETFLSKYKYGAVQVSPPNDHVMKVVKLSNGKEDVPWWVRYQPVSYSLAKSRSGTADEFADMVRRCNRVGVRIVVDSVVNHMVGAGLKYPGQPGTWSSSGSNFDGSDGVENFPVVPYTKADFNDPTCHRDIQGNDYNSNAEAVRNCRLVGLLDLDHGKENVRRRISDYFNRLLEIGVAGFRVDAVKHMWPGNVAAILSRVNHLNSTVYGPGNRPFVVLEVIDYGGEAVKAEEYLNSGRITHFKYGRDLAAAVRKMKNFKYFFNFGPGWGYWPGNSSLVFVDNHDNQRTETSVVTYKDGPKYILAVAFMLAWPYGYPRVMSSYNFTEMDQGPPTTGSPDWVVRSPSFKPDQTCSPESGRVCEHRWPAIRRMVLFRSAVEGEFGANVVTDEHRIAFRRGRKGFFALNNADNEWTNRFFVGLPAGSYCDVISGEYDDRKKTCTGAVVSVDSAGQATVKVQPGTAVAIHIGQRLPQPPLPPTTPPPTPASYKRTVIMIQSETAAGQDVFIKGGLDHQKHGCKSDTVASASRCAIPIRHKTTSPESFTSYRAWSVDDDYLDWFGAEPNQGIYEGQKAEGTPMVWTTNNKSELGYNALNAYGRNYWLVDVMMDCNATDKGWFELKAFLRTDLHGGGAWETSIRQVKQCQGAAKATTPSSIGQNHAGLCGMINVFKFNQHTCEIKKFS